MKKLKKEIQVKKLFSTLSDKINAGLWSLGQDAFLVILILVLFGTFVGELLFYQYIISVVVDNPAPETAPVQFKENVYQSVLEEWEVRESTFKNSGGQQYQTPFL